MPTPTALLQDPATQFFAMFGAFTLWAFIAPGRPLPRVRSIHRLGMLLLRDVSQPQSREI